MRKIQSFRFFPLKRECVDMMERICCLHQFSYCDVFFKIISHLIQQKLMACQMLL